MLFVVVDLNIEQHLKSADLRKFVEPNIIFLIF